MLREIDGVEVELVTGKEPFVNVLALIKGAGAGRRIVFNGHLDTFRLATNPVGRSILSAA